jgi:15-cis-phytoene synthase
MAVDPRRIGAPVRAGRTGSVVVDEAYDRCEAITAAEARNFSYGIKLLPPAKRRAMSALYALARRIDDIGDGDAEDAQKLDALVQVRKDVAELPGELTRWIDAGDPVMIAVSHVNRNWPLPITAIEQLIDGCEMDVIGTRYETFEDLVGYCRRVAGTVGRLSLAIYGGADSVRANSLADDLGVALQLTNILRDVVEDRGMGRVYLPVVDLARFGIGPDLEGDDDDIIALLAYESARAEEWYERGLELLPLLDRRSRAATAAMAGIYRRLLTSMRRDPRGVLRGRMSLPAWQKSAVALRALTLGRA